MAQRVSPAYQGKNVAFAGRLVSCANQRETRVQGNRVRRSVPILIVSSNATDDPNGDSHPEADLFRDAVAEYGEQGSYR